MSELANIKQQNYQGKVQATDVSKAVTKGRTGLKGIFSNYRNKKTPRYNTSWSDADYLFIRMQNFNLARTGWGTNHGDEGCRGYNAASASMTKLDSIMATALDGLSKFDLVKDWEDAQKVAMIDKCFVDAMILYNLFTQKLLHSLLLQPTESSAFTSNALVWDLDDYRGFIHSLEYKKYPIFEWSLNLAKTLVKAVVLSSGYKEKSKLPMYFMYFYPNYTITQMEEVRSTGYHHMESLEHARKSGFTWKVFSEAMIAPEVVGIQSEYRLFMWETQSLVYYDGGSSHQTTPLGGLSIQGEEDFILPIKDSKIPDIYALFYMLGSFYESTHADHVAVSGTPLVANTTEDAFDVAKIAYNGSLPQCYSPDSDIPKWGLLAFAPAIYAEATIWSGNGDAEFTISSQDIVSNELMRLGYLEVTGLKEVEWEDYLITAFRELWTRPLA